MSTTTPSTNETGPPPSSSPSFISAEDTHIRRTLWGFVIFTLIYTFVWMFLTLIVKSLELDTNKGRQVLWSGIIMFVIFLLFVCLMVKYKMARRTAAGIVDANIKYYKDDTTDEEEEELQSLIEKPPVSIALVPETAGISATTAKPMNGVSAVPSPSTTIASSSATKQQQHTRHPPLPRNPPNKKHNKHKSNNNNKTNKSNKDVDMEVF